MNVDNPLDALRHEIDGIDDSIHDLLMRRAEIVDQIRQAKFGGVPLRPGREATILRRLVARHRGRFPKTALVRIWREIFAAIVGLQGPFSLAVYLPEGMDGYLDLARDQYGSHTPVTGHQSSYRVIDAVSRGQATVGILPLPQSDDAEPWWPHLVGSGRDRARIVARLPFAGPSTGPGRDLQALVIGKLDREKTGRDMTFIALDVENALELPPLRRAFASAGLKATLVDEWADDKTKGPWLHLAEVEGYVADDDPRLDALRKAIGEPAQRVVALGGYAQPLGRDELAGERGGTVRKTS